VNKFFIKKSYFQTIKYSLKSNLFKKYPLKNAIFLYFIRSETNGAHLKILDRYILRSFLTFVGWAFLGFLILFYVVDVVENVDKFIDKGAGLIDVIYYYMAYTPFVLVLVSPIALLLAANFVCGSLSRHREIVAVRSGTISTLRAGLPIIAVGLLWSVGIMLFGELVLPRTNALHERIKEERINQRRAQTTRVRNLLYLGEDGNVYSVGSLDPQRARGTDILIVSFGADDRVSRMIRAREARYERGRWTLYDGHIYSFGNDSAAEYTRFTEKTLPLRETPEDLAKRRANPDEMGFFELRKFISRVQRAGGDPIRERTDLLMKVSFPFINFIILLFGVPLALRVRRSGFVMGFAQSLTIGFLYFGAIRIGQVLGYNGTLSPFLAATMGNIIFGSAGLVLFVSMRE